MGGGGGAGGPTMALSILSDQFCIQRPCKVTLGWEQACPGDELRAQAGTPPPAHGPSDNHQWLVLLCPRGDHHLV